MAGYIGSKASVVSSGAERKKTFAITTTTTALTGLVYTPTKVHVFHNGVRLVDGTDFTATNSTSITLTVAAESGDQVVVVSYASFQTSDTVSASAGGTFANSIDVTGTVTADGLIVDGSATIKDATEPSLRFLDTDAANSDFTIYSPDGVNHLRIKAGSSATDAFSIASSGDISFYEDTGTTPKFFWDASAERLGLGTSSPSSPLDINAADGVADNAFALRVQNLEATDDRSYGVYIQAGSTSVDSALSIADHTGANSLLWVAGNGDVGIGTSSPSDTLDVERATGVVSLGLQSRNSSDTKINFGDNADGDVGIINYAHSDNTMRFTVNAAERMRLTSDGSFLLGTGGINYSANYRMSIAPDSATGFIIYKAGSPSPHVAASFVNSSASEVGAIRFTSTATSYQTSSDYRLKTDAQPMTGASARVQALNPVNFEWIADGTRVDGFLAHEAQAVVPESVTGTKDAMMDEEYEVTAAIEATYDDDGNELTAAVDAVMGTRSVPDMQGIDQAKIVPLLTAALQEALNKIDTMETRLAALEGN